LPSDAALPVDRDGVMEALRDVIDPELGLDVVELGMVGDIEVEEDSVRVGMRLTSMSCPFWELFVEQVKAAVGSLGDVGNVHVEFDRTQPWSPELMSERAREELDSVGLLPPSVRRPEGRQASRAELLQIVEGVLSAPGRSRTAGERAT
jgi:metal-sulfur cluster biosynthetic enzyme